MTWTRVILSRADILDHRDFRLQDEFDAVFEAFVAPEAAAMFGRTPRSGVFECYFSPHATAIFGAGLTPWRGEPCAAPAREHTALLVGHTSALNMLAPAGDHTSGSTPWLHLLFR